MLFVSRHKQYRHQIWSGEQRFVRSSGGSETLTTVIPNFTAEFQPGRLSEIERRAAARQFGMGHYGEETAVHPRYVSETGVEYKVTAAATAMPYAHDGIIVGAAGQGGDAFVGYDPQFHLSSFDTDRDIPYSTIGCRTDEEREMAKAECERILCESPDLGSAMVIVDQRTIPAPWPAYYQLNGAAGLKKAIAMIEDGGHEAGYVLEYERATKNRPEWVEAFKALHDAQVQAINEREAERQALMVTVQ